MSKSQLSQLCGIQYVGLTHFRKAIAKLLVLFIVNIKWGIRTIGHSLSRSQTMVCTVYIAMSLPWASYQIHKIAGCACAGNAGNVFPRRRFQGKPLVSDPGMHHGTCGTHMPWCMSGSLTCGDREKGSRHSRRLRTRYFAYLARGLYFPHEMTLTCKPKNAM